MAISHAPFDELDVEDLTSVLQAGKFDIYLNGHVHNLALYSLDSDLGTYIQSGAGCMVYHFVHSIRYQYNVYFPFSPPAVPY